MTAIHLVRADQAPTYAPPGHDGVSAARCQGLEAGGASPALVARSWYEAGARATTAATPMDTVYLVVAGELVLSAGEAEVTSLAAGDSVFLPAGTTRSLTNAGDVRAEIVVVTVPGPDREAAR